MQNEVRRVYPLVQKVEANNPDTNVYGLEYSTTTLFMMHMYEEGLLDQDFPNGYLCGQGCLYRDQQHPGDMTYDMSALVWLNILYGSDPMSLSSHHNYTDNAVSNITTAVINMSAVVDWP